MKLSKRIFTLFSAALVLASMLSLFSVTSSAAEYTEGMVVADLDTLFDADVYQDENALMKPVAKIIAEQAGKKIELIKPLDYYGGTYYKSDKDYSATIIQKAGAGNNEPYAGINFGRDNEPGGVAITIPVDGTYTLRGSFSRKDDRVGGSFTSSWIYATVNNEGDPIVSVKFWKKDGSVPIEATVSLKKGDVIYVLSDPNGTTNAFWEDFTYFESVTLTLDKLGYNASDNVKKWKAGDEIGNINTLFDRNVFESDTALMKPVTKKLKTGEIVNMDTYGGDYYNGPSGTGTSTAKEGRNGEPYATTNFSKAYHAIGYAFTAPVSGTYQLHGLFNRKHDSTDSNTFTQSWYYVNVNNEGDALYSEKFWKTEGGVSCDLTVELVAGDILYVFTDPNGGENAWWEDATYIQELSLKIVEVSAEQPPVTSAPDTEPPVESTEPDTEPVATTPEESESDTTTTEPEVTTEPNVTTEGNATDKDGKNNLGLIIGIVAAVVVAVAVVVIVVIKKKK